LANLSSDIEVRNEISKTTEFEVDESKIVRAFTNILKNAEDAMPQGGKLSIKSDENEGLVKVWFTDTGSGISEENQKKMFQPLFTTKAKGMGFGLAICQRIVEAHGGEITVESSPGSGSIFRVDLPKRRKN
jgi:signal transduction histidine kinase